MECFEPTAPTHGSCTIPASIETHLTGFKAHLSQLIICRVSFLLFHFFNNKSRPLEGLNAHDVFIYLPESLGLFFRQM